MTGALTDAGGVNDGLRPASPSVDCFDASPETRDSVAPGYGYSPSKAIGDGVSCQTGTDNGGSVSLGLLGAGVVSPSLDTTSDGWKLLL